MTLEELYQNLSLGVLSNLAVGDEGSGFIPFEHQPKVCKAINDALLKLHSRFVLHEKEVQVRTYDEISLYPLRKIYADQDPTTVAQKFIADSVGAPFQGDVMKILDVYDELGVRLVVNDPSGLGPIYTPNATTLQVLNPATGNTLFVLYQAGHVKLSPEDLAAEIDLPDVLFPALEAQVAYLILCPMNGQEHAAKANEHLMMYEAICNDVLDKDLVSTSTLEETVKLDDRGWK